LGIIKSVSFFISRSISLIDFPAPLIVIVTLFLIGSTIYPNKNYFNTTPKISSEIYLENEFFTVGEYINIEGYIQIDFLKTEVQVELSLFNWNDGSLNTILKSNTTFKNVIPKTIKELNKGEALRWKCNDVGDYSIKLDIKILNEEGSSVSFIKSKFIVLENKNFINLYSDKYVYDPTERIILHSNLYTKNEINISDISFSTYLNDKLIQPIINNISYVSTKHISFDIIIPEIKNEENIYLYLEIYDKNDNSLINNANTRCFILNNSKYERFRGYIREKYPLLKKYPELSSLITDSLFYHYDDPNGVPENIIRSIIEKYHNLDYENKKSLFLYNKLNDTYYVSQELFYWLMTDLFELLKLNENDTEIILALNSIYYDYLIQKDSVLQMGYNTYAEKKFECIQRYIIAQINYFGIEKIRDISQKYGLTGLIHILFPTLFNTFGNINHQFVPINFYEKIRNFAQNTSLNNRTISNILNEVEPPESIDVIQKYLWRNYIQKDKKHVYSPTTLSFCNYEGENLIKGEKFGGDCITVSKLIILISRSLGIPIGVVTINDDISHWGNYQLSENDIIFDTQTKQLINDRKFEIRWPTLDNKAYKKNQYNDIIINDLKRELITSIE
jgi:hypothetical protein